MPDDLLQTWQYEGQDHHFNDNYPGYAIFISNGNADRAGSLMFGKFLGKELQARGLRYTPHYTLPLMRHRRRELLDADAGVYRYDELIVLQRNPHAGGAARSRVDRQPAGGTGTGEPGAPRADQRGDRCGGRGFLRGARSTARSTRLAKRASTPTVAALRPQSGDAVPRSSQPKASPDRRVHTRTVWLRRNASVLMIMKLIMLTPTPAAKAGA